MARLEDTLYFRILEKQRRLDEQSARQQQQMADVANAMRQNNQEAMAIDQMNAPRAQEAGAAAASMGLPPETVSQVFGTGAMGAAGSLGSLVGAAQRQQRQSALANQLQVMQMAAEKQKQELAAHDALTRFVQGQENTRQKAALDAERDNLLDRLRSEESRAKNTLDMKFNRPVTQKDIQAAASNYTRIRGQLQITEARKAELMNNGATSRQLVGIQQEIDDTRNDLQIAKEYLEHLKSQLGQSPEADIPEQVRYQFGAGPIAPPGIPDALNPTLTSSSQPTATPTPKPTPTEEQKKKAAEVIARMKEKEAEREKAESQMIESFRYQR